jgi:hypothetical protein
MIRLKTFALLISLCLGGVLSLSGQNLFDQKNSESFANYLLRSQQYNLAAMELERIVFMNPNDISARKNLLISYRKAQKFEDGIQRIMVWYPDLQPDSTLSEEWLKLLLHNKNYQKANNYLSSNPNITTEKQRYYKLASLMLEQNWDQAHYIRSKTGGNLSAEERELETILLSQNDLKYKNPALALGLSALVPGLGKVYSKDWKDGLISLLFVATNGWQAYRGFSKDGISSVYGWIFATLTAGFYGSSLYGSWKSAKDYNLELNHDIYHEIEKSVYSRF